MSYHRKIDARFTALSTKLVNDIVAVIYENQI